MFPVFLNRKTELKAINSKYGGPITNTIIKKLFPAMKQSVIIMNDKKIIRYVK
ncbi:MAG: hypothetical protein ACTSYZ_04630 [Candidatus Helarchaeota archaeon]